jgi:hypothetical protein
MSHAEKHYHTWQSHVKYKQRNNMMMKLENKMKLQGNLCCGIFPSRMDK